MVNKYMYILILLLISINSNPVYMIGDNFSGSGSGGHDPITLVIAIVILLFGTGCHLYRISKINNKNVINSTLEPSNLNEEHINKNLTNTIDNIDTVDISKNIIPFNESVIDHVLNFLDHCLTFFALYWIIYAMYHGNIFGYRYVYNKLNNIIFKIVVACAHFIEDHDDWFRRHTLKIIICFQVITLFLTLFV